LEVELAQLQLDLRKLMTEVREAVVELRRPYLETLSLSDAVRRYLRDCEERTGIWVASNLAEFRGDDSDVDQKLALCRVRHEALRNTSQHSRASQIRNGAAN